MKLKKGVARSDSDVKQTEKRKKNATERLSSWNGLPKAGSPRRNKSIVQRPGLSGARSSHFKNHFNPVWRTDPGKNNSFDLSEKLFIYSI